MEPIKAFSNVVIGQFVLTRIPIKVYVNGRYLTITSTDDIQDPLIGFGMDEDGQMHRFDYRMILQLSVGGNVVDLDTYNKAMGADGGEEESAKEEPEEEEPKKEESIQMSEISRDVLKAKLKANDLETKALKDKKKELQALPIDDSVIREDEEEIEGRGWGDLQTYGDLQTRIKNIKKDKRNAAIKQGAKAVGKKAVTLAPLVGTAAEWIFTAKDGLDFLKKAMSQPDANSKDGGFIGQLDVDDDIQDIVDDTVEDNFLKDIEKFIMSQASSKELGNDFSMNRELQIWLDKNHNDRGVQRPIGVEESIQEYTFGTGDIVKNINPNCEHFGSIGVIKKIIDLPNGMGKAAVYTVGNSGSTFKPGMGLTKTLDQLEKYNG
tara:strand:- start:1415 stop:2548 length:1134 start_codon:yes stop_codon:yes gene_type:complete